MAEQLDDLQYNNLKIFQDREGYCFTSDSVLLANFVKAKPNDLAVEVGSGSGVISILVQAKNNLKKLLAFEVQQRLAEMSKRSVVYNNLQDKICIINDRVQNFRKYIQIGEASVVFSNPPYRKNAIESETEEKRICRHEKTLTLDELLICSSSMLKFGGKFFCIFDANRSAELLAKLRENKLEPKRIVFTQPNKGNAVLIMVEAIKGGKEGVTVLPTIN